MNFKLSFSNPIAAAAFTGSALVIGWAIGAHWGRTTNAVWMLFIAGIFLYLHDMAIAVLLAMSIAKAMSSSRT